MSKTNNDLQAEAEDIVEEAVDAEVAPVEEASKAEPKVERAENEEVASKENEEKPAPEKDDKKSKKEKKGEEDEEKVLEEKVVTLNLRHAHLAYSRKPTPRSVRQVKKTAGRIFKTDDVKIDNRLNHILWSRGKTKSQRKVSVKIQKLEGGTVRVLPATE
jgi:large subunit ribosomal protein L31e